MWQQKARSDSKNMVGIADIFVEEHSALAEQSFLDELLPALHRLDRLLEQAATVAPGANGADAADDPYRGLYISQAEYTSLLARQPGAPALQPADDTFWEALPDAIADDTSRLAWLQQAFGLSRFDLDLLLIALAPELDRRYERLYAYLQDHVSRQRPSVDLALNLLCANATERLVRRRHFEPNAPLIRHRLIQLSPEPNQAHPSLLSSVICLDEQIVRLLLHQDGLDTRLRPFCQLLPACTLGELSAPVAETLHTLLCERVSAACPEPASPACVPLVRVTLPLTEASIDQCSGRSLVYSNALLYELILCLAERLSQLEQG
jgi:hypothetical protein